MRAIAAYTVVVPLVIAGLVMLVAARLVFGEVEPG